MTQCDTGGSPADGLARVRVTLRVSAGLFTSHGHTVTLVTVPEPPQRHWHAGCTITVTAMIRRLQVGAGDTGGDLTPTGVTPGLPLPQTLRVAGPSEILTT